MTGIHSCPSLKSEHTLHRPHNTWNTYNIFYIPEPVRTHVHQRRGVCIIRVRIIEEYSFTLSMPSLITKSGRSQFDTSRDASACPILPDDKKDGETGIVNAEDDFSSATEKRWLQYLCYPHISTDSCLRQGTRAPRPSIHPRLYVDVHTLFRRWSQHCKY